MLYATHALVDLSAIHRNLEQVRRLAGDRAVLVPVKADAYGHGAVPVAQMVERTGVADWLGVASVPEALALRETGVTLPVLKLSQCFPEELEAAITGDVDLAVVDADTIAQADSAAARTGRTGHVHLKVDTGMRRIGCEPADAVALAQLVDQCPHLELRGIFTHLPVSDMDGDAYDWTVDELDRFRAVVAAVEQARGPVELVHGTASGGVLQHDLDGMTLVRPGIVTYGYYPDASTRRSIDLEPAMSVLSRVSFVKQVRAGETVGYGRSWTAPADTWIATIPVGYADGWSRKNSNAGHVLIGGRRRPVVGRVCMDQSMVDLGPDGGGVRVGDEVVVLGRQGDERITADELAGVMGTISYEVTCLFTARVVRQYVED